MRRFGIVLGLTLMGCASGPAPKVAAPSRLLFLQNSLPANPVRDLDIMDADLTRLQTQSNVRLVVTPLTGALIDAIARVEVRRSGDDVRSMLPGVKDQYVLNRSCFDVFLMGPDDESVNPNRFKWVVEQDAKAMALARDNTSSPEKERLSAWIDQTLPVRGFYAQPRSIYGSTSKYLRLRFCGEKIRLERPFAVRVEEQSGTSPAWLFRWDEPVRN